MSGGLGRLADALAWDQRPQDTYGTATFVRTDPDGTSWVRLAGSDTDTPVNGGMTVDASEGDTVTVRQDGTRLYVMGNGTTPAVGHRQVTQIVQPVQEAVTNIVGSVSTAIAQSVAAQKISEAVAAIAEATSQHFWADDSGAHVTQVTREQWEDPEGEGYHSGPNVLINSVGQLFRDGLNNLLTLTTEGGARALTIWDGLGNAASNVRAVIGETITLGGASESHAEIDSDSLQFVDGSGETFFLVNDAAEASEATSLVEIFESTGSSTDKTLTLQHAPARTPIIYRTDGRPSTITSVSGNVLTLEFALHPGSIAIVPYETTDYHAMNGKTMMLGVNESVPLAVGAYSASVGTENQPSGDKSMTVGNACRTVNSKAFASGGACLAAGEASVAHGVSAKAVGIASFAQGGNVVAYGPYQHAIGRFNEIDIDGNYPLVIGNGTTNGNRSNALTVDWDGVTDLGPMPLSDSASGVHVHGSNVSTTDETASASVYGLIAGLLDRGDSLRSYLKHVDGSSGVQGVQVETRRSVGGSLVYNGVQMLIDASGNRTVVMSDAAAWHKALGYTPPTAIPLNSASLAYSSNETPRYTKQGYMVTIYGAVKPKSDVSAGGTLNIGTMPSGYRPPQDINVLCQGSGQAVWLLAVRSSGAITASRYRTGNTNQAMTTGVWLPFCVTYPTITL